MVKSIEETYQKKTPKEHILLRPDTYIGSVDIETQMMYIWDENSGRIIHKMISYVPGLYKIFDEILVNAADNKQRDSGMKTLKVDIDNINNCISIYNDGKGIPVEMHAKEGIYVPELIFGHLLTSSNYDDKEKKTTGGRNGYGAKLCNIFSTEFIVETADGKKRYKQKFSNNMDIIEDAEISITNEKYTCVTFRPDLSRFGMTELGIEMLSLLRRRVYDMCGTLRGVCVWLDGKEIPIKSFREYVKLYINQESIFSTSIPVSNSIIEDKQIDSNLKLDNNIGIISSTGLNNTTELNSIHIVHQQIGKRWELAFCVSEEQFGQVSFVNGIATSKGGTHVNHVVEQLVERLVEQIRKKEKGLEIRGIHVRSAMFLFINCLIENPCFDSQTKENLTLRPSAFGSKCEPLDLFVKEIIKNTDLIERVTQFARARQSAQLRRTDGAKTSRLTGVPKLEDANMAGTKRSGECTLILTEGDSAKTLAVAGLSVVGRDLYGVFPLRGKLLNVREASHTQILENVEISAIKKILGLQQGKEYKDIQTLRYGHVMIMTDQDHDGSHIKGLIINFFDYFFPSLLKIPSFLLEFITPIIRATKPRLSKIKDLNIVMNSMGISSSSFNTSSSFIDFFTLQEYALFRDYCISINELEWSVKYYKGLGTSTSRDAKQYFSDLPRHMKQFGICASTDRQLIDLAFNRKKADLRKDWLARFEPGTYLDQSASIIPISEFINRELILFSIADNIRSIPSVVDGLKPGQRKVLFSCFKRNLRTEIKVAQLVGYVSEQSSYHHGEASLCATIVNLAHDFVGSNNINLLLPLGSFGSRLQGGKDAASPRYIYTSLNPLTRLIFPEEDDSVLTYLHDDNLSVEPEFYVPILPMVLVNGVDGIGTGWSTSIPNYNPLDIINNIKRIMRGEPLIPIIPYYRNFRGKITPITNIPRTRIINNLENNLNNSIDNSLNTNSMRYTISGLTTIQNSIISITELPVGTWTQTYKEYLETLLHNGVIKDYKEYHTEKTVDFLVAPLKTFPNKLNVTISTSNMICFDSQLRIKKYESPLDIIRDFYDVRLKYYKLRKEHTLAVYAKELAILSNKVRFITAVTDQKLIIYRRSHAEIVAELEIEGYDSNDNYDYLLSMRISSLTKERIIKLNAEYIAKKAEKENLENKTLIELWEIDLKKFEDAYLKVINQETAEYDNEIKNKVKKTSLLFDSKTMYKSIVKGKATKEIKSNKKLTAKEIKANKKLTAKEIKANKKLTAKEIKAGKKLTAKEIKANKKLSTNNSERTIKKVKKTNKSDSINNLTESKIDIIPEISSDQESKPWAKYRNL